MAKKIRKHLWVILFIALALGVIIYFSLASFNKPAKGKVINPHFYTKELASNFNLTPVAVNGEYASFTYPAGLSVDPNNNFVNPVVAEYNYSRPDIVQWQLAISILNIPSGSLSDNNAYQFRQLNPATYIESRLTVNGMNVVVMTDKKATGFAKVAFLVNGKYQAIISLIGDDQNGTADLEDTFMQIVNSWVWHAD